MAPIKFKRLHPAAKLPTRAHPSDAGWDLHTLTGFAIEGGGGATVNLMIAWEGPPGWYAQLVGRSSLARRGIAILGGCIDAGYRGPWIAQLANVGTEAVAFSAGDRIAQFVLLPIPSVTVVEVDELAESDRGTGGFGSTGR